MRRDGPGFESEYSSTSPDNDGNLLIPLGNMQQLLPTIHGIDPIAVHRFEQVSRREPNLVPETPLDEAPNAKARDFIAARRVLRVEPGLLQELRPAAKADVTPLSHQSFAMFSQPSLRQKRHRCIRVPLRTGAFVER